MPIKSDINTWQKYKEFKPLRSFIWLFLGALGTALSIFFRDYVVYREYDVTPPFFLSITLFEYAAFSTIAFLFPWSWKLAPRSKWGRFTSVFLTAVLFTLAYVVILSYLEWYVTGKAYRLWQGIVFTLMHSALFTLVLYGIIAIVLYFTGVQRHAEVIQKKYPDRIPYRKNSRTVFINVADIQYFKADGNYVSVITKEPRRHLIRHTLRSLENKLDPSCFVRIHRQYMVNLEEIASFKVDPGGGYILLLKRGKQLKVSKGNVHKVRSHLQPMR